MIYIESPANYNVFAADQSDLLIFLAGGISHCPQWQKQMVSLLSDTNLILLNPRREDFPIDDPSAALSQITWEHDYLRLASAILFWFPCETLCPIVLFELGAWAMAEKLIFVGVHPDYLRRQDVEIQLSLERPEVEVVYSLSELASQVIDWYLDETKPLLTRIREDRGPA